jgi:hypothetical protein
MGHLALHRVVSSICNRRISDSFNIVIFIAVYLTKYLMQTKSVQVHCDVYCKWDGNDTRYRLYINDELFTERTWIWPGKDYYLEEVIPIEAPPGLYKIRYELLEPTGSKLKLRNMRVATKNAAIHEDQITLEIPSS